MAWIGICSGIFNTCGSLRLNRIGKNKESNEEYDKDLVEEEFQLATVKFGRNGERSREALGVGNCSINIWNGSELELAGSKKIVCISKNIFR